MGGLFRSATFAATLATAGLIAAGANAKTITIGTLPQGSLAFSTAAAVAKVISDKTDINTRAVGFGGSNIFIPQLGQGKLEMTTATIIESVMARNGTGIFKGKPHKNLRVLTRLLTFDVGFMVEKTSKIQALTDFKGQPFPSDFTSQKVVDVLVRAAFAAEGMSYADVKRVPVPNFIRGTDELVARRVKGSFLAPGSAVVRKANASMGIRFLSLNNSPAKQATLSSIAPGAFFKVVKPSKRMPYIEKPTTMIGFDYMILTHAGLSDEVAYKAAKALHGGKKSLVASHGIFNGFQPGGMAKKDLGIDYHPGAIKFYRESGQWPPK